MASLSSSSFSASSILINHIFLTKKVVVLPSAISSFKSFYHSSYHNFSLISRSNNHLKPIPKLRVSPKTTNNPISSTLLSDSTCLIAQALAVGLSMAKVFGEAMGKGLKQICMIPTQEELSLLTKVQENLFCSASMIGTLFFASLGESMSRPLNTPLTVVAIAMAKFLEIYAGILMVRVLFTWFPNVPWDCWPLSAVRDLCDPYLNLFRNILPPVMGTLDVSPLLAFQVLNILTTILNNMGAY
ncbi:hypothetical protein AQUCO_00600011v1 [Aquilegia coerulea]|uniref:YGGT family protein n=1 Tax=Aquilegia coerulea TaxID=218851 RepID=A0A2G5EN60_AQUCA|nr:hypothetical protein AQUCO_00600011v1 [Aquilegia coerulea]